MGKQVTIPGAKEIFHARPLLWLDSPLLSCQREGRCSQAHREKRLVELGAYCGGMCLADAVSHLVDPVRKGRAPLGEEGESLPDCCWQQGPEVMALSSVVVDSTRHGFGEEMSLSGLPTLARLKLEKPWLRSPYPVRLEDALLSLQSGVSDHSHIPLYEIQSSHLVASDIVSKDYIYTLWARTRKALKN